METQANKIIAVNATALISGGALSILRQFIHHVDPQHQYYLFVSDQLGSVDNYATICDEPTFRGSSAESMDPVDKPREVGLELNSHQTLFTDFPPQKNIHLIPTNTQSPLKRILWDAFGLKRWFKKRKLMPDTVLSLQNTSVRSPKQSNKLIYLHQGLPLHEQSWSFLKPKQRSLAFYKYLYPLFILLHARKDTQFIVQTQWMKKALCSKFKRSEHVVHVIKPEIKPINTEAIETIPLTGRYNLFYPASALEFKNHKEIIYALDAMQKSGQDISDIAVYFTITETQDSALYALIKQYKLEHNIHFLGQLSYHDVLIYYKSCTAVVFPSYIESFGLPLIEAAMFGKPLIVLDAEYAREVIAAYPQVSFVKRDAPLAWRDAITNAIHLQHKTEPYRPSYDTGWDDFFKILHRGSS